MTAAALRLGIISLGMAGLMVVESLRSDPRVELVGGADPDSSARSQFHERTGAPVHSSAESLCADPTVDAVWIASPTRFHREHVEMAARAGRDIVVEKPMAPTVSDCDAMIAAASEAGVTLLCGGVRSLDPAFVAMRGAIDSGAIGSLQRLSAVARTGWLRRPRSPADLDENLGGGLVFNQAPHQVDTMRLLAGGRKLVAVTASSRAWMPGCAHVGHYRAELEFADGVEASITYDGHGYFTGTEQYGPGGQSPALADVGQVMVDGTEGAARLTDGHVVIETVAGVRTVVIGQGDAITEAVSELIMAREHGVDNVVHTASWGRTTLETVCAIAESAHTDRRIAL